MLAPGKRVVGGLALGGGLGRGETRAEERVEIPAPVGDDVDRLDELRAGRILEDVAARARGECTTHVHGVLLHREHERLRRGSGAKDVGQRVDPASPGHHDVEQDDIGRRRTGQLDRLTGVRRLADDHEVRLALEQLSQPGANERVVIAQEDANRTGHSTSFLA